MPGDANSTWNYVVWLWFLLKIWGNRRKHTLHYINLTSFRFSSTRAMTAAAWNFGKFMLWTISICGMHIVRFWNKLFNNYGPLILGYNFLCCGNHYSGTCKYVHTLNWFGVICQKHIIESPPLPLHLNVLCFDLILLHKNSIALAFSYLW